MKKSVLLAVVWILILAAGICMSPFLSVPSEKIELGLALEEPSLGHPLGTDPLGRDLASRMIRGAGVSLGVGIFSVLLSLLVGVLIGAAAGWWGGWRDKFLMALTDIMLCFPTFFLILAVIAVLGPGLMNLVWIIGLTGWMGTARILRAEVLSLKEREFILALKALGAGSGRVVFRHLIPNAIGPAIVNAVLGISAAILTETGLSFLGIGVQPPMPSWGNILTDGQAALGVAWWLTFFPGMAILLTVLSVNVLGEWLHERHFR